MSVGTLNLQINLGDGGRLRAVGIAAKRTLSEGRRSAWRTAASSFAVRSRASRESQRAVQLTKSHTLPDEVLPQASTKIVTPGGSVMLKEKMCSLLIWTPCEAPFTFNSI